MKTGYWWIIVDAEPEIAYIKHKYSADTIMRKKGIDPYIVLRIGDDHYEGDLKNLKETIIFLRHIKNYE